MALSRTHRALTPLIHIPPSNIFRFGDPNTARPVFRRLEWTVHENEAWAVVGSGSGEKNALFMMLQGHLRISPPAALFPFLSAPASGPPRDPHTSISMVSFGNRRRAAGGAFYDYTARYGAVRDEDRLTLRQSMFPESQANDRPLDKPTDTVYSEEEKTYFDRLVSQMGLQPFLDLPLIVLSNGQTRRARIIKAIMSRPEILLLDEPLTGLDVQSQPTLLRILHSIHSARSPRVIIGLRTQDIVPEWITHIAFINGGKVLTGRKEEVLPAIANVNTGKVNNSPITHAAVTKERKLLVDMKNVGVKYGPRTVLHNINWEIRQGDRWHLQGTNGSGKTTLLSLLTGDHPQSYTQAHLHLHGLPRRRLPTPHLHALTGLVSPELFDAFPRSARARTRVWDVVGTGFDGGFVAHGAEGVGVGVMAPLDAAARRWRVRRCWEVLEALGPRTWAGAGAQGASTGEFKDRAFVDLSVGEQRMVLLMRALVGRPPLVLLDEVWSGMDEGMVRAARRYLREGGVGEDQAVVVITHWEDEVPWALEDGAKRFKLDDGKGSVVT